MNIASFITSMSIPVLGFNWIDILIVIVTFFYAIEGYSLGFFIATIDFISFLLSFVLGLTFYSKVSEILVKTFSITQGFANAIGFFIAAAFFEVVFNLILKSLIPNFQFFAKDAKKQKTLNSLNRYLGVIPGAMSGLLLSTFILSLIIALPFATFLKHSVTNSKVGSVLVSNTQGFEKGWSSVFGGAINDTLTFLTVEPKGDESVSLNFKTKDVTVDHDAEAKMFGMVNHERTSRGFSRLTFSQDLAKVGRAHCVDMFARGYFSHYTPEGLSPFDRMAQANISFTSAGENLALSPNVDLAMSGLMQSPGHKANILSPNFGKVGIGVIDGGVYGQMYCQEFTN